jgi:hypothetical protein
MSSGQQALSGTKNEKLVTAHIKPITPPARKCVVNDTVITVVSFLMVSKLLVDKIGNSLGSYDLS